jgi:hypothetical protein
MQTLYFWRYTYPLTGRRTTTRFRLGEEEAKRTLLDPERVEYGALTVKPLATVPSDTWVSGLVMWDGAMVLP